MKKSILLLSLTMSILFCNAQTYYTGWDDATEQAGWAEYRVGADTIGTYNWGYEMSSTISAPNLLAHYYPVGGSVVTDDWFVSPMFNFVAGGTIDSLMYKFSGFGTPIPGDTVAVYLLSGSPNPNMASSSQLLKIYAGTDYMNDDTWRLESNLAIPATAGNSYLAFRYKTINNWLDVKFDNLKISYDFPASVSNKLRANPINVYPNPSSGIVGIKSSADLKFQEVALYNMHGQNVAINLEDNQFDTAGLSKGFYVLKVQTDKGVFTNQLVVQ